MVRDGSNENANALGVFCGVKRPPEVTSSGNHLWVQFTSTEEAEGKGFLMSYDTGSIINEATTLFLLACFAVVTWRVAILPRKMQRKCNAVTKFGTHFSIPSAFLHAHENSNNDYI